MGSVGYLKGSGSDFLQVKVSVLIYKLFTTVRDQSEFIITERSTTIRRVDNDTDDKNSIFLFVKSVKGGYKTVGNYVFFLFLN